MNRLIESDISCVSNKVHTTRHNILGVYTEGSTQLEFYDSPGVVSRKHLLKHRLEDSLSYDPEEAVLKCDLIAVLVDIANPKSARAIDKSVMSILNKHQQMKSILIMNKVDLLKEKRKLLDIGTRLSQGCIEGECVLSRRDLYKLSNQELKDLNLVQHLNLPTREETNKDSSTDVQPKKYKYVIELDKSRSNQTDMDNNAVAEQSYNPNDPDAIGFKHFSHVFSISALTEDGVDELREHLISQALPVARWPNGPDFISNQTKKDVVHSIIRGNLMNVTTQEIPYVVKYNYMRCEYDELGSLLIDLAIKCPKRYMVGKVIGKDGGNVISIVEKSRESISKVLGCDVKLIINVVDNERKNS